VQAHVPQAVEERAGIFEHHAGLPALVNQLRDELAHALVAPVKDGGVVVVADARVVHHVLEIADDVGGLQAAAAGRNQRLVHVQRDGAGALDAAKVHAALRQKHRAPGALGEGLFKEGFRPAQVGQPIEVFR
jgi:hypothetical protein